MTAASEQLAVELESLGTLAAAALEVADEIAGTVDAARASGATWAAIADHLGVSRQAAQQRYGPTTSIRDVR